MYQSNLYSNGSVDPDRWAPSYDNLRDGLRGFIPKVGDLIAWRYASWRVLEADEVREVDLSDEDRERAGFADTDRDGNPVHPIRVKAALPWNIVLCHETGPLLLKNDERTQRLHDGRRTGHARYWPYRSRWHILREPYRACSCHGHVWPCQEIDQAAWAAVDAAKFERVEAGHADGVCFACREPISIRQKFLKFPEPSRLLPGAPGPTFHAGRRDCWYAAEQYERSGRLAENPDVARLASCPGIRFIHEKHGMPPAQRVECTAGPACTGHHGPAGAHPENLCWQRVDLGVAGLDGKPVSARPELDCGYRAGPRACRGADMSAGVATLNPTAADLIWEHQRRNSGGSML